MKLIDLVFFTWCLPQTLLGLILLFFLKINRSITSERDYNNTSVYKIDGKWGVSLGKFIIINYYHNERTIKHEYGHTLQGFIFGPIYLLVIGLPSITMNIISIFSFKFGSGKFARNYYKRWPESWADKLGNVNR